MSPARPSTGAAALTPSQRELLDAWLPGVQVVEDHSWGLTDTVVLRVRQDGSDRTVKAFGPRNHHFERELRGHREFTAPLVPDRRAPRLVRADEDARLLLLTWLPGRLVEGDPSAGAPGTHRQAGELLARLHDQPGVTSTTWLAERRDRTLRWCAQPHRIPPAVVEQVRSYPWAEGQVDLVPTHGDVSPRNWVVHDGVVSFIDLGRADLRPAASDLFRLQDRAWRGRPDLEAAFFQGYGADPRRVRWWPSFELSELVATAAWAHRVGDEAFEAEGLRGLAEFFDGRAPS